MGLSLINLKISKKISIEKKDFHFILILNNYYFLHLYVITVFGIISFTEGKEQSTFVLQARKDGSA